MGTMQVTPEQLARLKAAGTDLTSAAAIAAALAEPKDEAAPVGPDGAVAGVGYRIGSRTIPPPPASRFLLLQLIDSPFLRDSADGDLVVDTTQVARTLYVICEGTTAIAPLVEYRRRMDRLKSLERVAEKSPEFMELYLNRCDAIEAEIGCDFDLCALAYLDGCGNVTVQGVVATITEMIRDAFSGFAAAQLPDDGEKKTSSTPST